MKTIGIYPSQFQPPHQGHLKAYKQLRHVAGPDTFVVTTDYDPTLEAALHFGDKEQILTRHGIDASHIRKVRSLDNPWEILENFDPNTTIVIYALTQREAIKKEQSSKYYQPVSSVDKKLPFKHAAYILPINDNLVYKNKVYTSKNIREALGSNRFSTKNKQKWFKHFFGWFDLGLFELLKNKYENAHSAADGIENPVNIKEELAKEICNILNELMSSSSTFSATTTMGPPGQNNNSNTSTNQTDNNAPTLPTLADLDKQKKAIQTKLDADKNELQLRNKNVINFRKTLPLKTKELSGTSRSLAALNPSLRNPETKRQAQSQKNSLVKNRELGNKKLSSMKTSNDWEKDRQQSLRNDQIPDDKDTLSNLNKDISSGNYSSQ